MAYPNVSENQKVELLNNIGEIEIKLQEHKDNFDKWINHNYSNEEIDLSAIDSPSYPEWNKIEADVSELFNNHKVQKLSTIGIKNLIYLIGRNSDIGSIICWLNPQNKKFSNLGKLDEEGFYFLSEQSIDCDEEAQSQFATSFNKFERLNTRREQILLEFFKSHNSYTKRCSLSSLYKLEYAEIDKLIKECWLINDEWLKHTCLELMIKYNNPNLAVYIDKARKEKIEILDELIELKIDYR